MANPSPVPSYLAAVQGLRSSKVQTSTSDYRKPMSTAGGNDAGIFGTVDYEDAKKSGYSDAEMGEWARKNNVQLGDDIAKNLNLPNQVWSRYGTPDKKLSTSYGNDPDIFGDQDLAEAKKQGFSDDEIGEYIRNTKDQYGGSISLGEEIAKNYGLEKQAWNDPDMLDRTKKRLLDKAAAGAPATATTPVASTTTPAPAAAAATTPAATPAPAPTPTPAATTPAAPPVATSNTSSPSQAVKMAEIFKQEPYKAQLTRPSTTQEVSDTTKRMADPVSTRGNTYTPKPYAKPTPFNKPTPYAKPTPFNPPV
jgi:hypothetical protein